MILKKKVLRKQTTGRNNISDYWKIKHTFAQAHIPTVAYLTRRI